MLISHYVLRFAPRTRAPLAPPHRVVAQTLLAGALLCVSLGAVGQTTPTPADESLRLSSSPRLQEQLAPTQRRDAPTFLYGDMLTARPDLDMTLQGNVLLRRADTVIRADRLHYDQTEDQVQAQGNVHINRAGSTFDGPQLEIKIDAFEGTFQQPSYRFLANGAHGQADRVDFLDDKRAVIHNATYTSCQRTPGPSWLPDWLLKATTLSVDTEDEEARAQNASISFKGVTLLSLPAVSFALTDQRKSGVLPPTFGVDSISGTEVSVPYYWNIAPNRDATLYPTLMSKRGLDMGAEFRYLEPRYTGRLRANYLPADPLRERDRWGVAFLHQGSIDTGVPILGHLGFNLNLNRVSDDDYWRDFPRGVTSLTQRLLANDAALNWARGDYTATLRTLKWQTLQDLTAPITPPYDRVPQLAARYGRLDVGGFDFSVEADYTQFQAGRFLTGQPNAQRSLMLAQISRPWLGAAGFITPKLQLHSTAYQFDAPLAGTGDSAATRFVPTLSLDAGLVFERDANYLGRDFRQTLEPRLFYVHTPYRNQSYLPSYDTGASDFNFASIYTENSFVGHDRIADNQLITAGVTTRFLDPLSGAQAGSLGIAQRIRLADQNVTLPGGAPAQQGLSDVLLGASVNWDARWVLDSTVQYNPSTQKSVRSTVGARYHPSPYRVLNAAYRFQRGISEQLDIGWQWPLNDLWGDKGHNLGPGQGQGPQRWYSVGRLNYSLAEHKLVDSIVGLEYDGGCWLGRIVLERLQTGLITANQRIMFQLEFVGFSRIGIDPLATLKNNIPRYQTLRESIGSPSRFSNYD